MTDERRENAFGVDGHEAAHRAMQLADQYARCCFKPNELDSPEALAAWARKYQLEFQRYASPIPSGYWERFTP